ncbi:MAG: hypothetical protein IK076_08425 [Bacteroidales bacterium]|nr:hypothetical protein [Bacteroidales bacterium]
MTQRADYLGIPLHLDWAALQGGNLTLYLGAGGEAWKCIGAKLDGAKRKAGDTYLSAIGLAGLKYDLLKGVGIFLEPQYSHTFLPSGRKDGEYVPSAISDSPDNFSFRVGLSFSIK